MKKAQAAMEFLMTYGWAILVVLVAIGALAYFGVLSPEKFLPKSCTIEPGLSCEDFKADDSADTIQLILRNGRGEALSNVDVAITGCTDDPGADGDDSWTDGAILDDASAGITLTACTLGAVDARIKKTITITYDSSSGISHTAVGQITGKIEA